ncbi:MAG: cyclic nucleotide-binding domain-containing protein [Candidatus Aminicenantes bacterium]|nr:cyclic nucleotide-binding domain-containing protein [Candidatus Aminicenantes bacterium]
MGKVSLRERSSPAKGRGKKPDKTGGKEQIFAAGSVIFRPGDPGDAAYRILSGSVEILGDHKDKSERLAVFGEGRIFGELSLVNEKPRSVTARAVTESRLEVVKRSDFEKMILERPRESLGFLEALFERLRSLNARLEGEAPAGPVTTARRSVSMKLVPLTDRARTAVPEEGLTLTVFPFRIGRASEHGRNLLQTNDLALADVNPHFVSKNHLSLDVDNGRPVVRDRGSFLGTVVNGVTIGGGHRGAVCLLREGENDLVVGSENSPFRFRVLVAVQ